MIGKIKKKTTNCGNILNTDMIIKELVSSTVRLGNQYDKTNILYMKMASKNTSAKVLLQIRKNM